MYIECVYLTCMGRDSSVGIVTGCGQDGSGIEPRRGRVFPHLSRPALEPGASYTMGTGSFPGIKRQGRGVDHKPPS